MNRLLPPLNSNEQVATTSFNTNEQVDTTSFNTNEQVARGKREYEKTKRGMSDVPYILGRPISCNIRVIFGEILPLRANLFSSSAYIAAT